MNIRNTLIILTIAMTGWMGFSFADSHEKAKQLRSKGEILPLEAIIKKARTVHPGKILEVELEREHGRYVYEIEMLDKNGRVVEMEYDAKTGKLIKSKHDD